MIGGIIDSGLVVPRGAPVETAAEDTKGKEEAIGGSEDAVGGKGEENV